VIWILIGALLFVAIVAGRLLMRRSGRRLKITHLRLTVPDLHPDLAGRTIAFLSDLHAGRLHVPTEDLVEAVQRVHPDLLLLGGDYAAESANHRRALDLVRRLSSPQPTFGVAGNADHHQHLDLDALQESFLASGGELLLNEAATLRLGRAELLIMGVDDPVWGSADVDATAAQADMPADLRIAICHSPALYAQFPHLGAAFTLVGHSHGGQIRLPGCEAHFTHGNYPRRLASGLFRYRESEEMPARLFDHSQVLSAEAPLCASTADGPLLYVSRGVGMGVIPARLTCPPEMLLIELAPDDAEGDACDE
jgi:predicted MPP superfamily phosphohydrolase